MIASQALPFIICLTLFPRVRGGQTSDFDLLSIFSNRSQSLDLFYVQDFSESFQTLHEVIVDEFSNITHEVFEKIPHAYQGLAGFVDKPLSEVGKQSGDYCYLHRYRLTRYVDRLVKSLEVAIPHSGDDWKENQLGALLDAATVAFTGWRNNTVHHGFAVQRVIALITDSGYHEAGDTGLPSHDQQQHIDIENCVGIDYPNVDQVKEALESRNITPIFLVPREIAPIYRHLVHRLGDRGVVRVVQPTFTDLSRQLARGLGFLAATSTPGSITPCHDEDDTDDADNCIGQNCCTDVDECERSAYEIVVRLDHKPKHVKLVVDN